MDSMMDVKIEIEEILQRMNKEQLEELLTVLNSSFLHKTHSKEQEANSSGSHQEYRQSD